jgi:hypothetical protein
MANLKRRGKAYCAQYYLGGERKRGNLETTSLQVAKEKICQIESPLARECDTLLLPTKTPLPQIIDRYVFQLKARTSEKNIRPLVPLTGPKCNSQIFQFPVPLVCSSRYVPRSRPRR